MYVKQLPLVISTVLQQAATAERINVPSVPGSLMLSHISVNGRKLFPAFTLDELLRFCRRQNAKIAQYKR